MTTIRVDRETGEVVDSELHAQNEALQRALTKAGREATALRNENSRLKQAEVVPGDIALAYGQWRDLCRPRARERPGPRRREVLAQAIKRDGLEMVMRAIYGAHRYPYVVNGARRPTGRDDQRHDDLELICRNEVKVESFERLAWRAAAEDGVIRPGKVPDQVRRLRERFGESEVVAMDGLSYTPIGGLAEWWAPCPLHLAIRMADAPLRIRWQPAAPNDRAVQMKCVSDCDEPEIWKAVDAL